MSDDTITAEEHQRLKKLHARVRKAYDRKSEVSLSKDEVRLLIHYGVDFSTYWHTQDLDVPPPQSGSNR